ncbi:MAG TPA: diacylglycerol kinase family protein [Thermoanaerobaculia bacterium]
MRRGLLVYNPTAGQRDLRAPMSALIDRMRGRGLELVNAPTTQPGDATDIVRAFLPKEPDVVAALGGDGTISEVACGLIGSRVPLAVLPGGTSNVLARELSIPADFDRAAELLVDGKPLDLVAYLANDRPFLLWAGVGLDARIMGNMSLFWKRHLGRSGIFFTVLPEFLKYEFPRLEVDVDGITHEATFAVVSHVRHWGGDWVLAPGADARKDEVEVVLFTGRSRYDFFRLFYQIKAARGGHLDLGIARSVRGREVTVRSLEPYAVEVQVDGDCVLETPIHCRPSGQTIRVLVPDGENPTVS